MVEKQLLTFGDAALILSCQPEDVRSLVVEERALPALMVTHHGHKTEYGTQDTHSIGDDGIVFTLEGAHLGFLRITRNALDAFMTKRGIEASAAPGAAGARWPKHETAKLTALRLAAVKFWANYDRSNPDTAPKNAEVSAWLVETHKVSSQLADAMASILRADGLKTGPRPK